ncbi:PUA-like domain-containing protein [Mycena rebaudengoi]|nr:PUA-like domain-containing protein [Mycena rebaudengoi]
MVSDYERQRDRNIARNRELLKSLGLDAPLIEPKEKKPKAAPKKRKPEPTDDSDSRPTKAARTGQEGLQESDTGDTPSAVRRSSRNAGKTVDYKAEHQGGAPVPVSFKSGVRTTENAGPLGRDGGIRTHDPKKFGSIPGIEVGTWWETRAGCSADAIHAPWVAGISGGPDGAYSVALSGGYDDDVDLGYLFTYTGSGGRDLKGTKAAPKNLRTAPQSSDQDFENNYNKALKRSAETRKPIRVIRGFKLKSPYAPSEGYRYDGLYIVEKAWMEKGLNPKGFLVCKFAFKRLPNQPALPRRDDIQEDQEEEAATPVDSGDAEAVN